MAAGSGKQAGILADLIAGESSLSPKVQGFSAKWTLLFSH
jgi:hypothetical protein